MMKSILPASLILLTASCANIQHLTNMNVGDLQGLSNNQTLRMKYDEIKRIERETSKACESLGKMDAHDNALDTGEQYAILYLKAKVLEKRGDSVVVDKIEKVGNYGHQVFGEGFKCSK